MPTNVPQLQSREAGPKTQEPELSQAEKRAQLIQALSFFKPVDATPLQYYNLLRELCIMHECSIDESIEKAALTWANLSAEQRILYASARHAKLPIPVPRHLLYRALQMEHNARWSLGRERIGDRGATMYIVESYRPPGLRIKPKPTKKRPQPTNPCIKGRDVKESLKRTQTPPALRHKLRSPCSLRRILSAESVKPVRRRLQMRQQRCILGNNGGEAPSPKKTQAAATRATATDKDTMEQRRPYKPPKRGKRRGKRCKSALPVLHSDLAIPEPSGIFSSECHSIETVRNLKC